MDDKEYVLLVGSFIEPGKYEASITALLGAGQNVCIGLLDPPEDKSDPFAWGKRLKVIIDKYPDAYADGSLIAVNVPNIKELQIVD